MTNEEKQEKLREAQQIYEELQECNNISLTDYEDDDEISSAESIIDPTRQPKGWWSTESIIASLPTPKIKEILNNYKQAISVLENELISRRLSGTYDSHRYTRDVLQKTGSSIRRCVQSSRTTQRRVVGILTQLRPRLRSVQNKQGQAVACLLKDTWRKILEVYLEEKEKEKEKEPL